MGCFNRVRFTNIGKKVDELRVIYVHSNELL